MGADFQDAKAAKMMPARHIGQERDGVSPYGKHPQRKEGFCVFPAFSASSVFFCLRNLSELRFSL